MNKSGYNKYTLISDSIKSRHDAIFYLNHGGGLPLKYYPYEDGYIQEGEAKW